MNLKEVLSNDMANELRRRGYQVIPPERRVKDGTVVRRPDYHVYMQNGNFFVDLYQNNLPIGSYATLDGVKEALYYLGKLPSKTSEL